jgi:hypothetical protein
MNELMFGATTVTMTSLELVEFINSPRGQAKVAELIERKAPWLRKAANQLLPHMNGYSGAPA